MKIFLLHGDDVAKSGKRLDSFLAEAQRKNQPIRMLGGATGINLAEEISKSGLFGEEPLYIVKEVSRVTQRELKWVMNNREKLNGTLVAYNEGELGKTYLGLFPKETKIEMFKLPKTIYKFLDSFYPGNSAQSLTFLHGLAQTQAPEFILAYLGRHLRDLYWVGVDPAGLPFKEDWRILKLANQSKKFKKGQIKDLIGEIAALDVITKTSSESFEGLLDQLIVSRLE